MAASAGVAGAQEFYDSSLEPPPALTHNPGRNHRPQRFPLEAPHFTENSEVEVTRYKGEHLDRNILLITAGELRELALEWASLENKNREQPFNLGLFAMSGRYDRKRLGRLF